MSVPIILPSQAPVLLERHTRRTGRSQVLPASRGTRVRSLQPTRAGQRKRQGGTDEALNYGSLFNLPKTLSYEAALG